MVSRRYLRSGKTLVLAAVTLAVLWSNPQVLPVNKPSWMPRFGEPGPPTDRQQPQEPLPRNLTLHLLPHSHSDIGWNLSFEGYYHTSVRQVLRRASAELWSDRARRFTWGDLAFLDMWMEDEGDTANGVLAGADAALTWRQVLKELMLRGQWEVVGGTYVSPDEGLTTWWAHNTIVDAGHRTLATQLNATTRVGWQIDNFGHHNTVPHVLSNTGYSWLVLGRMAYRDLYDFASKSTLQFEWRSSEHEGTNGLRTHFLAEHYGLPSTAFDFDHTNVCDEDVLLGELQQLARRHVRQYPAHGHVLIMMGDDFRFVRAARAFGCLDRLISASRKHESWRDMKLQYSTMTEYLDSVQPHLDAHAMRVHGGDFYPYQDKPVEQYWSGILGSRPYLKWLVRDTEQIVQHVEALVAMQRMRGTRAAWSTLELHLEFCRKQVAIGYHHDAITGTCTDDAFADYVERLRTAARVALRIGHVALQPVDDAEQQISAAYNADQHIGSAYNTATRDVDNAARDWLEIAPAQCTDSACVGAAVVVTNTLLAAQDVVVRLRVHSGSAVLVDETGVAVQPVHVQAVDSAYSVEFVVSVPALGARGVVVGNRTLYADAPMLRDQIITAAQIEQTSLRAELHQGGVHVRLRSERNGVVRIESGGRVVRHQMRSYFTNPYVQSSGAYIMHSFNLMYSIVFWIFGGMLASGLALAWLVHVGTRHILWLRHVRVPCSPIGANGTSTAGSVVAAAIGSVCGAISVLYAAQKVSVDRLDDWTRGHGVFLLAAPVFCAAYVVGGALRWRKRRACVCVASTAVGVFLALALGRAWQSRAMTFRSLQFTVEHSDVCSTARAQVTEGTSVEFRLCADTPYLLQASTLVHAPNNREIIARLQHGRGRTLELFDGASMRQRRASMWTPVSGTFYPAPLLARLGELSVHVRQPVGVSSLSAGMLDVLVHRSMTANDFRGLKRPLIDKYPARATLFVDLRPDADPVAVNNRVNTPPLAFVLPPHANISPHSALHSAVPHLSLVGIRAESDSVDMRLLAHRSTDISMHELLRNTAGAVRVHGDWSLCNVSAVQRTETQASHVHLRGGEQALFRLQVDYDRSSGLSEKQHKN
ncbi:Alpha-mannosidase 2 [Coemansia sp. RSA 1935]|nr:Alpha-mannosidase 2 [Coemansia sp. RSA 1935]